MKVYYHLDEFKKPNKTVVTTGTFDGVHVGHQKIISRLVDVAKITEAESVILTFFPHPRMVLNQDLDIKLIQTLKERIRELGNTGLDHLIIHPFSKEFSRLSSLEFVRNILVNQLGVETLVIGYDHHFGRNREGTFEHLKEFGPVYGFEVEEIQVQDVDQISVSSTKIRNALKEGDVVTAANFLTRPFELEGKVVKGQQLGRKLGFPTANIEISEGYKIYPKNGVYAVDVEYKDQLYKGMLNIGFRPTVEGENLTIEVHIFEFDMDIYNDSIRIFLNKLIREEIKFKSIDELKEQLIKDKSLAENV